MGKCKKACFVVRVTVVGSRCADHFVKFPNNLPPDTRIDRMTRDRKEIQADPELEITEFTVKARDEYEILVRSYCGKSLKGSFFANTLHWNSFTDTFSCIDAPAFIYMHGGGFVTGSLETDDKSCRAIAHALPIRVLSIEYRLAPEHQFPVGFEDCWDVLEYIVSPEAASKLSVNLAKGFLVGGTSAGANFTAGLAHRYHTQYTADKPKITGLVFWAGSWCHPDVRPAHLKPLILSVDEIDDAPGLTKSSIEYFWKKYGAPKDDRRYSPLLEESWKGVASKAYFAICGWDPRRDEAVVYGDILRDNGLEVRQKIYSGLPHGFWTTCPELLVSQEWEKETIEAIRWILRK